MLPTSACTRTALHLSRTDRTSARSRSTCGRVSRTALVVAQIGQEITLRRLRRIDSECVEIERENPNPKHRCIRIDAQTEDVEIVGGIVGAVVGVPRTPD